MKYLVAGSTGLIGKNLINIHSANNDVIALARRNYQFPKNVEQLILDYDKNYELPKADHLFICLGFPVELLDLAIMRRSVKKLFYKVDYDYVCNLAKQAKLSGIENISVISSVGAHAKSFNFYLKTKGLMEQKLKNLNFKKLNIFQPSHLLGERDKPQGHDVKLFEDITNFSGQFLFGPLKKFKNVKAEEIAQLMAKKSSDSSNGINIYTRLDI